MKINIFTSFKYPLSKRYRSEMEASLQEEMRASFSRTKIKELNLYIKDEKQPSNSKKRKFKLTLMAKPKKQKAVVISQSSSRLSKAFNNLLESLSVSLEKAQNKYTRRQQVAYRENKRHNPELIWESSADAA